MSQKATPQIMTQNYAQNGDKMSQKKTGKKTAEKPSIKPGKNPEFRGHFEPRFRAAPSTPHGLLTLTAPRAAAPASGLRRRRRTGRGDTQGPSGKAARQQGATVRSVVRTDY